MDPSQSSPVQVGSILAGKYRVDRILGQGGMGVVVAATHLQLEQQVAIKFLLGHASTNPEAIQRFSREARAATKIQSEHVVRVSDVGTLETGAPYMVMEYLHGQDLAQALEQRGRLPIDEAVDYLLQTCEALAEAHVAGIVHRDLKPANIYLSSRADGTAIVKVLDFGISKLTVAGSPSSMTRTSALMGSPLYMSPEQMRSTRDVDARSDIWSLGMILFELLAGKTAFHADTIPELCVQILTNPPPPLRSIRPDAPARLEAVATRCLEKDPAQRFQNVAELAQALAEFAPPHAQLSVTRVTRVLRAAGAQIGDGAQAGSATYPGARDSLVSSPALAAAPQTVSSFGGTHGPGAAAGLPAKTGIVIAIAAAGVIAIGLGAAALFLLTRPHPTAPSSSIASAAGTGTDIAHSAVPKSELVPSQTATAEPKPSPPSSAEAREPARPASEAPDAAASATAAPAPARKPRSGSSTRSPSARTPGKPTPDNDSDFGDRK